MDGRESQRPIVVSNRGNGLPDPVERRGCRVVGGELEPRRGHRASPACHRETTQSCEGQRFPNVTNRMPLQRARPDLWEPQGAIPGATRPAKPEPRTPGPLMKSHRIIKHDPDEEASRDATGRLARRNDCEAGKRRRNCIMTIHLSKDLVKFVQDAVRDGLYAREDDVIRDALLRLKNDAREENQACQAAQQRSRSPGRNSIRGCRSRAGNAGFGRPGPQHCRGCRRSRRRRPNHASMRDETLENILATCPWEPTPRASGAEDRMRHDERSGGGMSKRDWKQGPSYLFILAASLFLSSPKAQQNR